MASPLHPDYADPGSFGFPYPRVSLTVRSERTSETLPPAPNRPRRVLIVHDERGDAAPIESCLRGDGLDATSCTSDGDLAAALERADLIVVYAPRGAASLDLCRRLRLLDHAGSRPVIVCGGSADDEETVVSAFEYGADDYVAHAGRTRELVARVRAQFKNLRDREVMQWARAQRSSMRDLAHTDAVTGIANRRGATRAIERALAGHEPVCVVLADIDHFKRINDTFGHPVGDAVLRRVARALEMTTPSGGLCARWGGEEFAIVLRGEFHGDTALLGERMRCAVSDIVFVEPASMHVTVSIGVASWDGLDAAPTSSQLVAAADAALYQAKRAGRNRVSTSMVVAG